METRGSIVHTVPMFTADSVPGPLNKPIAPWQVRAWRRKRLIFGARYKGRDYFPAFQFQIGRPKPLVHQVLVALGPWKNWDVMFWFVGANGWLEDAASPYKVMDVNPSQVEETGRVAVDFTNSPDNDGTWRELSKEKSGVAANILPLLRFYNLNLGGKKRVLPVQIEGDYLVMDIRAAVGKREDIKSLL